MNTNKFLAQSIAKEYSPKEDSQIVALKKLDAKVKRPARVFASIFGTVFCLVAGTGMCLAMPVIGSGTLHFVIGIIIGTVGFGACAVNYPIYKSILNRRKAKYAYDVVELARRICDEN